MKREVSILIPTRFDSRYMIELCLETVKKYTEYPYRIIVGDAGVDEETGKFLECYRGIRLVKTENQSLPKDSLIKFVETAYFLFLHDDTQIFKRGWLKRRVALMEKNARTAVVGPVVANLIYGWKRFFLYKRTMRRFWPLALLVKTDVQRELGLRWGVVEKGTPEYEIYREFQGDTDYYDTGAMAYQQLAMQRRYKVVPCKFHREIRHFGGMTWPVKKKVQNEKAIFNINNAVYNRNKKLELIKQSLLTKNY